MTKPDRKNAGMIVSRSTIPSKETRKRSVARPLPIPGYRKFAVQMRSAYSMQKIKIVYHIPPKITKKMIFTERSVMIKSSFGGVL